MKIKCRLLPALLAAMMLFGCSSGESSSQTAGSSAAGGTAESQTQTQADAEQVKAPEITEKAGVMPVINITTKSSDKDAIKFATEPVSKYVSKEMAMWTPGFKMPPAPYYEDCFITVTDTSGTNTVSGAEAQVKVRGNWTTSYPKKPLRIKFAEKQTMLGLNGGKEFRNWVLLALYKDGSMLRDKTSLEAARGLLGADGLYASDSTLVEVKINGEYFGVYLLAEQQQVNKNRVNVTKCEENYQGTDIGYFIEYDGYYINEDVNHRFFIKFNNNAPLTPYDGNEGSGKTVTAQGSNKKKVGFTIKSDIYSSDQKDFIANFVDGVYKIMYEAAYNQKALVFDSEFKELKETTDITPREAVERVVDTDSLADIYLISELTCDADIYWSSFYMSADFGKDGSKKLRFEAPWDFDSGLGNKDRCADGTGFYAANIVPDVNGNMYTTVNPWLAVLMYEDWFEELIKEKWTRAYDNGVFSKAAENILSDTENLADAFDRNYLKWDNIKNNSAFANELSSQSAACRDQKQAANFLHKWFTARVEFMNEHWHK